MREHGGVRRVSWSLMTVVIALAVGRAPGSALAANTADLQRLEDSVTAAKEALRVRPGADAQRRLEAVVAALQEAIGSSSATKATFGQASEVEPNDTFGTATAVPGGDYGTGDISPAGDVDFWSVAGAAVGDLVFAQTDTGESTTTPDTTLTVRAADGSTLIEFDDDDGGPLESAVAGAPVPQAGAVFFEIHEFGDNALITPYHLTAVVVDPASAVAESEPNDDAPSATPVTAPMMTAAVPTGDVDFFSFPATAGDRVCVIMDDDPDNDGGPTATLIQILDTDGSTTILDGDNGATADANAAGTVVVAATGTYYLRVAVGAGSDDSDYSFVVVVDGGEIPVELQSLTVE